ncbi:MAG: UDP-N-acetylmuramoylalanine--D-glutamate ligase [Puniceicoccaceae bacterium]|nr:MAG: UDP-N-acetylmuramoylalanine--D-glutamate ligase [Puniceicoccaceae bacterium]
MTASSLFLPHWLKDALAAPVAVLGAGRSGLAAAALLRRLGAEPVLYDEARMEGVEPLAFDQAHARRHRLVVYSPGFPPRHPWLEEARGAGCECVGEMDLAGLLWPGRIIAVTGTNGKTTITAFLAEALRALGLDARAAGNIGRPFASLFTESPGPESIAVCEVSSFQAETMRYFRAWATLWPNFAEDHLERHRTLEKYFHAKYNLVKRTEADRVFFGPSVFATARSLRLDLPVGNLVPMEHLAVDPRLEGTPFARFPQRTNYTLVETFWKRMGWPVEKLLETARTFQLPPHRLNLVATRDGVEFWNDSKATNYHAVEAALDCFSGPVRWIAGGRMKGGDLAGFAGRIHARIEAAYFIGEAASGLARAFTDCGHPDFQICSNLEEAVTTAAAEAHPGDTVLFSPAFASYDQFRDYADRGERFETCVRGLRAGVFLLATSRPSKP